MKQTMIQDLEATLRNRWLSPLDALRYCRCMSLSQRCGELRRRGVNVLDRWTEANGKRFKEYRIV